MLNKQEIEQGLKNATGRFEYRVNGGALIVPAYLYRYYDPASGVPAIFKGRDTPNPIGETGVTLVVSGDRFWGDKVLVGSEVSVQYVSVENQWGIRSGVVSGMFHGSTPGAVFEFDFTAFKGEENRRIQGHFILKPDSATLNG